jgi:S1-C subfamily serine protease
VRRAGRAAIALLVAATLRAAPARADEPPPLPPPGPTAPSPPFAPPVPSPPQHAPPSAPPLPRRSPAPSAPVAIEEAATMNCERGYVERVYRSAKPSVVRITRPDGGLGTGFVFHSRRHVATALHVVDLGRGVRVELPEGKTLEAEVVAWDDEHDLAILELPEDAAGPPLEPRWHVAVGAPILAIGNPYGDLPRFSKELEGLLNYSVSQGVVSAKSSAYIQTDASLSPGNSGGPVLTCDGRVVGVADRLLESRIGFAVPIWHLSQLAYHIGERRYAGRWVPKDGALGLVVHSDVATYVGFYLGGSVVGWDRVALTARIGLSFAGKPDTSEPIVDRSVRRFFGELTLGYRMLFFPYAIPTYLTLGAGALGTIDRGEETRLGVVYDAPGCPGAAACAPRLAATTDRIRGGGVQPMAQAVIDFGSLEVSYGYALDVVHPKVSTHRLLFGLSF